MSWNYRVVSFEETKDEAILIIKEVYYNEEGKPYGYSDASVMGNDEDELIRDLDHLVEATNKPILHYPKDFNHG